MPILMDLFRAKMAASKDDLMKQEKVPDIGVPTGFLTFDFANGCCVHVTPKDGREEYDYYSTGVVDGSMIVFFGRPQSGKTTLIMQMIGNIARNFPLCEIHHEDPEGGLNDARKMQFLGFKTEEEFKSKYICRNTGITTENFFARFCSLYDLKMANRAEFEYDTGCEDSFGNPIIKLQPTILFLDSLMMLYPEKYVTDSDSSNEVASQMAAPAIARMNTQILRRIVPKLKAANIIFFMINHILPDPNTMPHKSQNAWLKQGERLPGGDTGIFLPTNIIRVEDSKKITADDTYGIDGQIVKIQLCKTRTNNPGIYLPMVMSYAKGFDNDLSVLELLKERGYVKTASWCNFTSDPDVKFQQKKFKTKLAEDEKFRAIFIKNAQMVLTDLIKPPVVAEEGVEDLASAIMSTIRTSKSIIEQ